MSKNTASQLEQIKTADLVPYARNAKKHEEAQVAKLAGSIREFGFNNPVLIDADNGIIAGHGRVMAAQKLGLASVPCLRLSHLSETQKRAYILADNRLAELGGGWDGEMLKLELADLGDLDVDLDGIGFGADDLQDLELSEEPEASEVDAEPQIDKAEELRAKWGVEPGQLWELGDHRLLCADSTKKEDVERVMGGETANALVTDPPYGMRLDADYSKIKGSSKAKIKTGGKTYAPVIGDDQDFDATSLRDIFSDVKEQFWFGADYYRRTLSAIDNEGSWLVWDKRNSEADDIIGAGFELCWSAQKHQRRVLRHYWVGAFGSKEARDRSHPTQKPTALICDIIARWTEKGAVIAEPFNGSGTTIIACEQLGRKCRAIEISPAYVAVAIQRWADATGKTPKLVA
jgi:DNA modification methylase